MHFILFLWCLLVPLKLPAAPATSASTADSAAALVQGNTRFALELYGRLGASGKENLFFSPFSISSALAMTSAGARGQTARQMSQTLHFPSPNEGLHAGFAALTAALNQAGGQGKFALSVANRLWGRGGEPFQAPFLALVQAHYGAGLQLLDFAASPEVARRTINAWVEEQTAAKVRDLIPPGLLDAATALVLTNAIYFKGTWAAAFKPEQTRDEPFRLDGGRETPVPMMSQTQTFGYAEDATMQALELPYAGARLSMVVLLPREPGGLAALERDLSDTGLNAWLARLKQVKVEVYLPRFRVEADFSLRQALAAMGMAVAFSRGADFSGINGKRDLFLSAVLHKAFVDVNEEGTEAAAATAVVMKKAAMSLPPVFRADHPFLFLIRDRESGTILFLGRLVEPRR